jgi:hypothetical protein
MLLMLLAELAKTQNAKRRQVEDDGEDETHQDASVPKVNFIMKLSAHRQWHRFSNSSEISLKTSTERIMLMELLTAHRGQKISSFALRLLLLTRLDGSIELRRPT